MGQRVPLRLGCQVRRGADRGAPAGGRGLQAGPLVPRWPLLGLGASVGLVQLLNLVDPFETAWFGDSTLGPGAVW
jgi:hypothetical protein